MQDALFKTKIIYNYVIPVARIRHVSIQCDALNKENLRFCVTFSVKRTMPQNYLLFFLNMQMTDKFYSVL